MSLVPAVCVVISNMIGTGVFTSLGFQVASMSSGFVLLMLWVVGGVCALCGALTYAELGAALPRSGGEYALLTRIYSRPIGFLAGWVSMTAGFPAAVALSSIAFSRYLHGLLPAISLTGSSVAMLLAVTAVHWAGVRAGSRFQTVATLLKVGLIVAVVIFGVLAPWRGTVSFLPADGDGQQLFGAPFAISLVFVMFAYSGWNAATYISEELAHPARNVPRSLLIGTGIVLVLYLAINWFFLFSTPAESMKGQVEVGLIAGRTAFGSFGGTVVGAVVAVLLVSSVSSMVWIGPRVTMAVGEDLPRLAALAQRSPGGAPQVATAVQTAVTLLLMLTGTFESVLFYLQFTLLLSSGMVAVGVFVLRRREPDLPRPYRTWGYPVTPAVFIACTLWMMAFVIKERPMESILGFLSLLLGLAVYFWAARAGGTGEVGTSGPGTYHRLT